MPEHDIEQPNQEPTTSFNTLLRGIRNERGWSQGQLASELGLDHATIVKLEAGLRIPGNEKFFNLLREKQVFSDEEVDQLRSTLPERLGDPTKLFENEIKLGPSSDPLRLTYEDIIDIEANIDRFLRDHEHLD